MPIFIGISRNLVESMKIITYFKITKKLEKVGPFECDELEKHCRVSAKCYPTTVPALYTMTKEKFKKSSMLPEITD